MVRRASIVSPLLGCLLLLASGCGAPALQPPAQSPGTTIRAHQGSGGPQLQGFLATGVGRAYFISWTRSGDMAQGSIYYAQSSGGSDPIDHNGTSRLTATISGSALSINFDSLAWGGVSRFQGTLASGLLTIEVPRSDGTLASLVFSKASQSNYNSAVRAVNAHIAQADNAYQRQQQLAQNQTAAQRALQTLTSTLQYASKFGSWTKANPPYFGSVLAGYATDWSSMQGDWKREQVDFANATTGPECGQVGADAGQVGADAGAIGADDGAFQAAEAGLTPLAQEEKVASSLQGLYQAVVTAAAAPGVAVSVPAQGAITADIMAAARGIAAYKVALARVQAEVAQYDTEAHSVYQRAAALASKCTA